MFDEKNVILQTKRLSVSIPTINSLGDWYKLHSDKNVMKYISDGKAGNQEETKVSLLKAVNHYEKYGFTLFDIYKKNTNEFIGEAGLIYSAFDKENKDIEVGYTLHKKYWDKGYATELAKIFIDWGFNKLHLNKIVAYCQSNNTASSNVMKKCGMRYNGKYLYNGKYECDIYVIDKKDDEAEILLSEHNPEWPLKFRQEKDFLMSVIGKYLNGKIEHIGSTAVPGLIAKPVIDIMFGVKSLQDSKSAIELLTKNGYNYFPYKADIMHWFCKPSPIFRTHHLHLVPYESNLWKERIKFRNILRANAEIASKYVELKKALAMRYKEDRETYTKGKTSFIKNVLKHDEEIME